MSLKVLHIADPHIDSPLKGLAKYPGLPEGEMRSATRRAFANAVAFALKESVDVVLIAGDLFDGTWKDMGTGLWVVDQFLKLRDASIPVGFIRGNHDALSKVAPTLKWPENVYEFQATKAETWVLEDLGLAVHGQSFADQAEIRNLAAGYPSAVSDVFNVGLLHTSLAGSPDHDTYAPTSTDTLLSKGYDYWALGHIHQRASIDEASSIVFAGNLQGRHIREAGAKGAMLLTVDNGNSSLSFHEFDVVRWNRAEYRVHEDDSLDDVLAGVESELAACRRKSEDRPTAVRVEVTGIAGCHDELAGVGQSAEFATAVRSIALEYDDVWIEQIRLRTSPPVDLEALRKSDGLLAALFDEFQTMQQSESQMTEWDIGAMFEPLVKQSQKKDVSLAECGVDLDSIEDQKRWLSEAESILLSTLATSDFGPADSEGSR